MQGRRFWIFINLGRSHGISSRKSPGNECWQLDLHNSIRVDRVSIAEYSRPRLMQPKARGCFARGPTIICRLSLKITERKTDTITAAATNEIAARYQPLTTVMRCIRHNNRRPWTTNRAKRQPKQSIQNNNNNYWLFITRFTFTKNRESSSTCHPSLGTAAEL